MVVNLNNYSSQLPNAPRSTALTTAEMGLDCTTCSKLQEIWKATSLVYSGGSKVNFFLNIDLFFNRELRQSLKEIQSKIREGDKNIISYIESGLI